MSFYNMINGVNSRVVMLFTPMLGYRYDAYARFRDAFLVPMQWKVDEGGMPIMAEMNEGVDPEERYIYILTRLGGGNRPDYQREIDEMRAMPEYVTDYDDAFDSTYATFVFEVKGKWEQEYDNILAGNGISEEYREHIKGLYPQLSEKLGI